MTAAIRVSRNSDSVPYSGVIRGDHVTRPLIPRPVRRLVTGQRGQDLPGPVLGDPRVDPFPPAVQPLDLGLMVGRTRYGITRNPPPPGPDDLIDRELTPHVGSCDDGVEPGVRYEDHVGVRAGRDGGERPPGARRPQVGHIPGPFGQ